MRIISPLSLSHLHAHDLTIVFISLLTAIACARSRHCLYRHCMRTLSPLSLLPLHAHDLTIVCIAIAFARSHHCLYSHCIRMISPLSLPPLHTHDITSVCRLCTAIAYARYHHCLYLRCMCTLSPLSLPPVYMYIGISITLHTCSFLTQSYKSKSTGVTSVYILILFQHTPNMKQGCKHMIRL